MKRFSIAITLTIILIANIVNGQIINDNIQYVHPKVVNGKEYVEIKLSAHTPKVAFEIEGTTIQDYWMGILLGNINDPECNVEIEYGSIIYGDVYRVISIKLIGE